MTPLLIYYDIAWNILCNLFVVDAVAGDFTLGAL